MDAVLTTVWSQILEYETTTSDERRHLVEFLLTQLVSAADETELQRVAKARVLALVGADQRHLDEQTRREPAE